MGEAELAVGGRAAYEGPRRGADPRGGGGVGDNGRSGPDQHARRKDAATKQRRVFALLHEVAGAGAERHGPARGAGGRPRGCGREGPGRRGGHGHRPVHAEGVGRPGGLAEGRFARCDDGLPGRSQPEDGPVMPRPAGLHGGPEETRRRAVAAREEGQVFGVELEADDGRLFDSRRPRLAPRELPRLADRAPKGDDAQKADRRIQGAHREAGGRLGRVAEKAVAGNFWHDDEADPGGERESAPLGVHCVARGRPAGEVQPRDQRQNFEI
mmetsp:Transcript_54520/g.165723  ORF Transcript_54520/g.165723 Transcript_54520/m.165723 type:complete len:269 (-) Transcript_54520:805-1611(-)